MTTLDGATTVAPTIASEALALERQQHTERVRTMQVEIDTLRRQLDIVGQMLLEEAQRRDWCSDYDRFATSVNEAAGAPILQRMARDFAVSFNGTLVINARSEDDAVELAAQQLGRLESRSDYGMTWDTGDVEFAE